MSNTSECTVIINPASESEVIRLINDARAKKGIAALGTPAVVAAAARLYAIDLACGKPTDNPMSRLAALGYTSKTEYIAGTTSDDQAADKARGYITPGDADKFALNSNITSIGVGYAKQPGTDKNSWVLLLTTP